MALAAEELQVDDFFIPDGSNDPFESQENEPDAPAAPVVPAEPPPTTRELREIHKRLEAAESRAAAAETSARFWSEKAGSQTAPAAAPKQDAPAIDLLEILTSGDTDKFKSALKQMGYKSGDEVSSEIQQARTSAQVDARLEATYPELKDPKSEMFIETRKAYDSLVAEEPAMRQSPKTVLIAARLAKAAIAQRMMDDPDDEEEDDEAPVARRRAPAPAATTREPETERVKRVSSQAPQRGTRASANTESTELDSMQKLVIRKFQDAGSDITEDGYKKRASKGIRMSGIRATRG